MTKELKEGDIVSYTYGDRTFLGKVNVEGVIKPLAICLVPKEEFEAALLTLIRWRDR